MKWAIASAFLSFPFSFLLSVFVYFPLFFCLVSLSLHFVPFLNLLLTLKSLDYQSLMFISLANYSRYLKNKNKAVNPSPSSLFFVKPLLRKNTSNKHKNRHLQHFPFQMSISTYWPWHWQMSVSSNYLFSSSRVYSPPYNYHCVPLL